ncbi:MAG TPA: ABC transporter substrate-binding protein [Herpetosiphonaceae bacterium]|nr:ABC transporter substrate-binding protein [Herpetosiphonaceae bacterium]
MLKRTPFFSLMMIMLLILAACGAETAPTTAPAPATTAPATEAPATGNTEPTAAPVEPTEAPVAEATAEPTADTGSTGAADVADYMTVSAEQQATWVRNFNPFVSDRRFPTLYGVHEPLMLYNTLTGELMPWLATEFAWSDDNKKLTFTIRDGVKWSDGEAFSAEDVAYTFNLLKENTALATGANAWAYLESVTAPDEKTVEFAFQRVFTPGLYDVSAQVIVPEHVWSTVTDPVKYQNENPVGTGPFTEVTVFENQIYALGKNPNYWQAGKPYIAGLRFPAYPGNDQANLATLNGENDWAGNFIPDIENTYVAKDPNNGYYFPALGGEIMLYLNTTKAPFDDVNVRKAISQAIDRDQIVTVAMYDYTKPGDVTGLSDAYPSFKSQAIADAGTWTKLDIEAANAALDAAGLAKGPDGIRVKADGTPMKYEINVVSGWTDWVSACEIMSQNLKEVGIDASVKTYDFSAWIDKVNKGEFDMSIGWSSSGATPVNFYRGQASSLTFKPVGEVASENWQRYVSPEMDKLLEEFAATSDAAEQKAIAEKMQQAYDAEAPAIPLFPGPMWYEYNTTRFTDFPTKDNAYAHGSPFSSPDQLLLLTTVKPKQ